MSEDGSANRESELGELFGRYILPALATITALSFMAGASAIVGVWRDVSVMRESMNTLIKNADSTQVLAGQMKDQIQDHELRLSNHQQRIDKGGL